MNIDFPSLVKADTLSTYATVVSVILTLVSILVTVYQMRLATKIQRAEKGLEKEAKAVAPPALCEFLLILLSSKKYGGGLLHDLDELFERDLKRGYPLERAQRRYRAEAIKAILPLFGGTIRRLLKKSIKVVGLHALWKAISG